jgi:hypothetical protein
MGEENENGQPAASSETTVTAKASSVAAPVDPSAARKRRKAIIESQRKESSEQESQKVAEDAAAKASGKGKSKTSEATGADSAGEADEGSNGDDSGDDEETKKRKQLKRTQIRYDPDVPMSKEQLAAWRREARRVRNRESAAASRQRIRSRINELETEVDQYKSKYYAAIERLKELEQLKESGQKNDGETNGSSAGEQGAQEATV